MSTVEHARLARFRKTGGVTWCRCCVFSTKRLAGLLLHYKIFFWYVDGLQLAVRFEVYTMPSVWKQSTVSHYEHMIGQVGGVRRSGCRFTIATSSLRCRVSRCLVQVLSNSIFDVASRIPSTNWDKTLGLGKVTRSCESDDMDEGHKDQIVLQPATSTDGHMDSEITTADEPEPSPTPNGGYGWVCVACCFTINCFTWGVVAVSHRPPASFSSRDQSACADNDEAVLRCVPVILPLRQPLPRSNTP